jgi:hypothetical protein
MGMLVVLMMVVMAAARDGGLMQTNVAECRLAGGRRSAIARNGMMPPKRRLYESLIDSGGGHGRKGPPHLSPT